MRIYKIFELQIAFFFGIYSNLTKYKYCRRFLGLAAVCYECDTNAAKGKNLYVVLNEARVNVTDRSPYHAINYGRPLRTLTAGSHWLNISARIKLNIKYSRYTYTWKFSTDKSFAQPTLPQQIYMLLLRKSRRADEDCPDGH